MFLYLDEENDLNEKFLFTFSRKTLIRGGESVWLIKNFDKFQVLKDSLKIFCKRIFLMNSLDNMRKMIYMDNSLYQIFSMCQVKYP